VKLLQIDFASSRPVRAGDQFCFGRINGVSDKSLERVQVFGWAAARLPE